MTTTRRSSHIEISSILLRLTCPASSGQACYGAIAPMLRSHNPTMVNRAPWIHNEFVTLARDRAKIAGTRLNIHYWDDIVLTFPRDIAPTCPVALSGLNWRGHPRRLRVNQFWPLSKLHVRQRPRTAKYLECTWKTVFLSPAGQDSSGSHLCERLISEGAQVLS